MDGKRGTCDVLSFNRSFTLSDKLLNFPKNDNELMPESAS